MNVTEANRYIPALNRIAEGVTMLASAIEEAAWESFEDHPCMSGARPIAAAQLAQPALEAAAEEHEAAHQPPAPEPAPTPTPEVVPVSLEQVRTVLARLSQAGHTAQVRELIQAAGANKLSEVDPSKYGQLLEEAEAIADA